MILPEKCSLFHHLMSLRSANMSRHLSHKSDCLSLILAHLCLKLDGGSLNSTHFSLKPISFFSPQERLPPPAVALLYASGACLVAIKTLPAAS